MEIKHSDALRIPLFKVVIDDESSPSRAASNPEFSKTASPQNRSPVSSGRAHSRSGSNGSTQLFFDAFPQHGKISARRDDAARSPKNSGRLSGSRMNPDTRPSQKKPFNIMNMTPKPQRDVFSVLLTHHEEPERSAVSFGDIKEEIITGEEEYIRDLEALHKMFIQPLQKIQILSKQQMSTIFPAVDTLLQLHREFLANLKKNTSMAEAFLVMMPYFSVYSMYIQNQTNQIDNLHKLRAENKVLDNFIKDQESEIKQRDLKTLLLKPVERLCHYPALMRDLKKMAAKEEEKALLDRINLQIVAIIDQMDERAKQQESTQKLLELQAKLDSQIATPSRKIALQGRFLAHRPGRSKKQRMMEVVLFNDLFLIAKPLPSGFLHTKAQIPFSGFAFTSGKEENVPAIEIMSMSEKEDKWRIIVNNTKERDKWLDALFNLVPAMERTDINFLSDSAKKRLSLPALVQHSPSTPFVSRTRSNTISLTASPPINGKRRSLPPPSFLASGSGNNSAPPSVSFNSSDTMTSVEIMAITRVQVQSTSAHEPTSSHSASSHELSPSHSISSQESTPSRSTSSHNLISAQRSSSSHKITSTSSQDLAKLTFLI